MAITIGDAIVSCFLTFGQPTTISLNHTKLNIDIQVIKMVQIDMGSERGYGNSCPYHQCYSTAVGSEPRGKDDVEINPFSFFS